MIAWTKAIQPSSALGKAVSFYELVKANFETRLHSNWTKTLQDGVVDTVLAARAGADSPRSFKSAGLKLAERKALPQAEFELVLYPTIGLRDGSMANVPWLQEFPDPITKICWGNYVSVSPKTAEERKLRESQVVKLTVGDRSISAPVHIQPGQHDNVLGLALGYGREHIGEIGSDVGVNAYRLAAVTDGRVKLSGLTATIEATRAQDPLAGTQGYYYMEGKTPEGLNMGARQIVVEATLAQYQSNPEANIERPTLSTVWSGFKYEGHKWGMSIDLSRCTGCSACVLACQSENNIPTIGKTYVLKNRQMFWMRIDRYFVGDPSEPDSVHIPVLCQHCDNAPCETVCPVAATVHSSEGTNDMIYNRCVGTRYCSNNCPYKVRRFNWFNYPRMNPQLRHRRCKCS